MYTEQKRNELEEISRSLALPSADRFRAKLFLMLADGMPYVNIQAWLSAAPRRSVRDPDKIRHHACSARRRTNGTMPA